MSITKHHSGRWLFQFDKVFPAPTGRQRANKLLPEGWTRNQADKYDLRETARLFDYFTGGKQPEPLIEDAVLHYLSDHMPGGKHPLKNYNDIMGALALFQPFYAGKRFDELPQVVDDYVKNGMGHAEEGQEAKPISMATKRNRLAYLRSACRYFWKTKLQKAGKNPGEYFDLPTVKNARHVYLTRTQMLTVMRKMGELEAAKQRQLKEVDVFVARMAVRVAFYTGWRIGMVLDAKPVIVGNGVLALSIDDSKNDQPQIVPVHHRIEHIVRDHWPLKITKWTVSKKFKAALIACDLGHARLHDTRHAAASEMINSDVDLHTVGKVLGHKSAVSTQRYAHLAAAKLAAAVGNIGSRRVVA